MYEEKNFDTIMDKMLERVAEATPEIDTREGSVMYNALAPAAIEMQDLYISLDTILNESFADTQSREFLIRRCAERGIIPNEATAAIRMGEFTGAYNIADVIGEEFSLGLLNYMCESCNKGYVKLECDTPGEIEDGVALSPLGNIEGLESATLIAVHISVKNEESNEVENKVVYLAELSGNFNRENLSNELSAGFCTEKFNYSVVGKLSEEDLEQEQLAKKKGIYRLRCTTNGKTGNLDSGELIPVEYIEGLNTARLTKVITPGRDEEDTEHLRQRYFDNANAFAFGGNVADYKAKVLSLSSSENGQGNEDVRKNGGVGYVKVEPTWDGPGTVKIIILDASYKAPLTEDSSAPDYITGHPLVIAVQEAIDPENGNGAGIAPIGHKATVVSAVEEEIRIKAQIQYVDETNATNKETVQKALKDYFISRIKEWKNDESLVITIGEIYMCLVSIPCVKSIKAIQEMKLNDGSEVEISIGSIPVLGGLTDEIPSESN